MGFIDLHVHSNASDGTMSPSEVVAHALQKQLEAIALTDHDTIDGIKEAQIAAFSTPLELIPGIELSCQYQGTEIHILGYFVSLENLGFVEGLNHMRQLRNDRNLEMIGLFHKAGIDLTLEELSSGNASTVITRAHFARILIEKGYVANHDQAFKKYLQPGAPCYVPKTDITPEYALRLLSDSGAFSSIAHPMQYHMGYREIENMIGYFKTLGLRGVEVYHSSHNQYQSGKLKCITASMQLLPTGGSDFHGANKPDIDIGTGRGRLRLSSCFLDDIKKAMVYAR